MPTKSTKTTKKSDLKISKVSEKKSASKVSEKKTKEKKDSVKKVVVKRRKVDLTPTKASAVAIASQANRAKKKALIEKISKSANIPSSRVESSSDTRIPLWVRVFFGCSLLLFCVSFYQAIIRPQIEKETTVDDSYWIAENVDNGWNYQEIEGDWYSLGNENIEQVVIEWNQWEKIPETATAVIEEFFNRLSNRNFDGAFDLMIPALRAYPDIKNHFTSFRMDPFLDWIEWWKLVLSNIEYIKSPAYWKDVYNFDLYYVMKSDQEKFEETWEFGVNTLGDKPKISSIRCISSKCSYHPIFWPENFGLMR